MWECSEGQTDRQLWPIYILPRLRLTRNVIKNSTMVQSTKWSMIMYQQGFPLSSIRNEQRTMTKCQQMYTTVHITSSFLLQITLLTDLKKLCTPLETALNYPHNCDKLFHITLYIYISLRKHFWCMFSVIHTTGYLTYMMQETSRGIT